MHSTERKNVATIIWLIIGIILGLSINTVHAEKLPGKPFENVVLQLSWYHEFQFAGYYAAQLKGYYQEEGLEVEIKERNQGQLPVDAVLSGDADFGNVTSDIMLLRMQGKPVVALAVIMQHSPWALLVRAGSGIKVPEDLIGKTVSMDMSYRDVEIQAMFKNENISTENMTIVRKEPGIENLINGTVDARVSYITSQPFELQKQGFVPRVIRPVNYGVDFYGDTLFTTERQISEHPQRVAAFRRASLRGWQYAMDHPEELIDYIYSTYYADSTQATVPYSRDHFRFEAKVMAEDLIHPKLIEIGHMNPDRWRRIADTYAALGMAEPIDILKGFIYDPNPSSDYKWVRWTAGIILAILLTIGICAAILFVFNRRLRHVVQLRTSELSQINKTLVQEVSERKMAEEKYRRLIENLRDNYFFYVHNTEGIFTYISPSIRNVLGYSAEEFLTHFTEYLTDNPINKKVEGHTDLSMKGIKQPPYEVEIYHKDGSIRSLYVQETPIFDGNRKVVAVEGIAKDITDRKRSEERITSMAQILEESLNEIYIFDAETLRFIQVNKGARMNLGYSMEELSLFTPQDLRPEFTSESFAELIKPLKTGNKEGIQFTTVHRRKDGSLYDVEVHLQLSTFQSRPAFVANILDITERKRAEGALHESEKKYRTLFEGSADAVFIIEGDNFVDCNSAAVKMLKYKNKKELLNTHPSQLSPPLQPDGQDSFEKANQMMAMAFDQGSNRFEWNHQRKNGEVFPVEVLLTSIPFKEGNFLHVVWRDITERKQAEEAVLKSEQQFRTLVSNIPGIVYRCVNDDHRTMRYISNSIEDLTGYSAPDFIGNNVRSFTSTIHHKDRDMVDRIAKEGVRSNQPFVIEYRIVSKDGSIKYVSEKGQGVFNKERELLWLDGAIFDITEQRAIEKELIKVQKLESVGVLAGGIAHDFNNSLQAILGNISLVEMDAGSNNGIQKYLNEAKKAVLQSRGLTQQLLTFSKGGEPVKKTISVSELIVNSTRLALSGSNVRCEFGIPDDLWSVEADKGQLNQVIGNLIINAYQAMPAGGDIKVCAENTSVADKNLLPLQEGRYVKIVIEDQGTGISEKHLHDIFDPYFTTKEMGSGLGLATAYSIIKQHNGNITVESEIGVGTTFHIYMPASLEKFQKEPDVIYGGEADSKSLEKKSAGKSSINKGKILIMDDEHVIRVILSKQLLDLGYEVEAVGEGSEAIRLYKSASRTGNPFDAVVMDLTIAGGMGGMETIKRLMEIDPEVSAIVVSGYANDPVMANYKKYGFKGVLAKPHEIYELDEALQKVIAETN